MHLPDCSLIEDGVAGEPAITLAPGDYQVCSGGGNIEVTINDNEVSTVDLPLGA